MNSGMGHCLTGQGGWEMRVEIELDNGTNISLQYEELKVSSAEDKYQLTNCWRISGNNLQSNGCT